MCVKKRKFKNNNVKYDGHAAAVTDEVSDQIRWLFSEWDLTDDGVIDREEFIKLFAHLDPNMSEEKVDEALKAAVREDADYCFSNIKRTLGECLKHQLLETIVLYITIVSVYLLICHCAVTYGNGRFGFFVQQVVFFCLLLLLNAL